MENALVQSAKDYAFAMHKNRYGKHPYSHHLSMVVDELLEVIEFVPKENQPIVIAAAYLHDVVEDCPETNISIIEDRFGKEVSDIVWALTNDTGKRASDEYYQKLIENKDKGAAIIKFCDRIANVRHCFNQIKAKTELQLSTDKINMYLKENDSFIQKIGYTTSTDSEDYIKIIQKLKLTLIHLFNLYSSHQSETGTGVSEPIKSENESRTLLIQIKTSEKGTEFGFTGGDLFKNHEMIGLLEQAKLAYFQKGAKNYINPNPSEQNNEQPGTN